VTHRILATTVAIVDFGSNSKMLSVKGISDHSTPNGTMRRMNGIQNRKGQIRQMYNDRLALMQRSKREHRAGHLHQVQMVVQEKQD